MLRLLLLLAMAVFLFVAIVWGIMSLYEYFLEISDKKKEKADEDAVSEDGPDSPSILTSHDDEDDSSGQEPFFKVEVPRMFSDKLKKLVYLPLLAWIILSVFGCFYNVNEHENAVVTQFGDVVRVDEPGLHFKIPWIQKVTKVDITTRGTGIGYVTTEDGKEEADKDGVMITSDFNFINIDFYMESKISDPVAYLYNSDNPEEVLRNIALASIRSTVSDFTVDEAMTTGKGQIQSIVKERMQAELSEHNIGLQVVNITIQDAEPPTEEIKAAFKAVESAKQGKETALNHANEYRNERIPAAEAEADRILQQAEAAKVSRIAEAEGQAARFSALYEGYKNDPVTTKKRIFYETMEDLLPDVKVIIDDGHTQTMLPLDEFSTVQTEGQ